MKPLHRLKNWIRSRKMRSENYALPALFNRFQTILRQNNEILELIADMGDKLGGDYVFDQQYLSDVTQRLSDLVYRIIYDLNMLTGQKYIKLYRSFERVQDKILKEPSGNHTISEKNYTLPYDAITRENLDEVGGKNANLDELRNVLKLPTPDGFAITTQAFNDFMIHHNFFEKVQNILTKREKSIDVFHKMAQNLQKEIIAADVPKPIAEKIWLDLKHLKLKNKIKDDILYIAIRSSASEEDTEHSFAGQFQSFLNIPEGQLLDCYKKVLASVYAPGAWEYRIKKGFHEHETAMSVGCQLMIHPKCSGVIYTMDPVNPEQEIMMVTATWGLGRPIVEGETGGDQYIASREAPYSIQQMNIVYKEQRLVANALGGTRMEDVPEGLRQKGCLSSQLLQDLVHTALLIERYFKRPQDIEWAVDEKDNLFILQTRPLQVQFSSQENVCSLAEIEKDHAVIFAGKGDVVQRGIAYGDVFMVDSDDDIDNCPYGAILVARQSSPRLTTAMHKAEGILTDVGSSTGHMANVAREFRIPTIVNTAIATKVLKPGDEITLNASENIVFAGKIRELCYYERTQEDVFEESYEYRQLRRMLKNISPLNLIDPHDENFRPENCKTYHDIVRFVHEKAVEDLMWLSEKCSRKTQKGLRRLLIDVPLGLYVIDIGNGIDASPNVVNLESKHITSKPMKAFLMGLIDYGLWATDPVSVDLGSFMSSVTRTFSVSMAGPNQVGRNLVVLSDKYMNISLRLGYHFNIIDAYFGESVNDNYAYFRFIGGVTDITRRSRRTALIGEILKRHDFRIEARGDLVIGRIKKLPNDQMQYKVALLGGLVAYTRQLDVLMSHDDQIQHYIDDFTHKWPTIGF